MIAKYSKKFPYAPYLNEDIGFDIGIPDNASEEEMIEAIVRLNRIATAAYHRLNPHIKKHDQIPQGGHSIPEVQVEKGQSDSVINEIKSAGSIESLKTYHRLASQNKEWKKIYDETMKKLSPKKKNGKPVLP